MSPDAVILVTGLNGAARLRAERPWLPFSGQQDGLSGLNGAARLRAERRQCQLTTKPVRKSPQWSRPVKGGATSPYTLARLGVKQRLNGAARLRAERLSHSITTTSPVTSLNGAARLRAERRAAGRATFRASRFSLNGAARLRAERRLAAVAVVAVRPGLNGAARLRAERLASPDRSRNFRNRPQWSRPVKGGATPGDGIDQEKVTQPQWSRPVKGGATWPT